MNNISYFIDLTERAFVEKFRLTKGLVNVLIEELRPYLEPSSRKYAISIERKVSQILYYYMYSLNDTYIKC